MVIVGFGDRRLQSQGLAMICVRWRGTVRASTTQSGEGESNRKDKEALDDKRQCMSSGYNWDQVMKTYLHQLFATYKWEEGEIQAESRLR